MNQKQQILHVKFEVGWLSFVITLIFLMGLCYIIVICLHGSSGLRFRLKVGVLCREHMVTEACDPHPPGSAFETMQPYTVSFSPLTGTAHYSLSSP